MRQFLRNVAESQSCSDWLYNRASRERNKASGSMKANQVTTQDSCSVFHPLFATDLGRADCKALILGVRHLMELQQQSVLWGTILLHFALH